VRIDVGIDTAQLVRRIQELRGDKGVAYSTVNAINATSKRVQQAVFEHVRQKFIVRKPAFFFGTTARPGGVAAKLGPPPDIKAGRFYREVHTGAEAVRGRRNVLLPAFEEGGTKKPTPPSKTIAVPLLGRPARPSIRGGVPPAYTFAGLRFRQYRAGKLVRRRRRGRTVSETVFGEFGRVQSQRFGEVGTQWKGQQRTFILGPTANAPSGGVYQRFGRGDIRMIYSFETEAPLDARLSFVDTARRTADIWFKEEMERELIKTIAHVRGRGL